MFNGDLYDIYDDLNDFRIPIDQMPKVVNKDYKLYYLLYLK
jgi:hypothetical protein